MKGKRVYPDKDGHIPLLNPGEYLKNKGGIWFACTPSGKTGNLRQHTVTEHGDGTISVSPSILVTDKEGSWHGYLEKGIWREC